MRRDGMRGPCSHHQKLYARFSMLAQAARAAGVITSALWLCSLQAQGAVTTECPAEQAYRANQARLWPEVFGQWQQGSPGDDGSGGNFAQRTRFGVSWRLDQWWQARQEDAYTAAECARFRAAAAWSAQIDGAEARAELAGRLAQRQALASYQQQKEDEALAIKEKLGRQEATIADLLEVKQSLLSTKLRQIDTEAELKQWQQALTDAAVSGEGASSARLDEQQAALLTKTAEAARLARDSQNPPAWQLALAGGVEETKRRGGTDEPQRNPFVSLELRYRLGALAAVAAFPSSQTATTKAAQDLEALQAQAQRAEAKQALLHNHRDELRALLAPLGPQAPGLGASPQQSRYQKLEREISALGIDEAYYAAKAKTLRHLLGTPVAAPAASPVPPSPSSPVATSRFTLTMGELGPAVPPQAYQQTRSPQVRIKREGVPGNRIGVSFRVLGAAPALVALGSGAIRQQFGVFLLATDQCNALYVMLRLQEGGQPPHLVVQEKANPGLSTHAQCQNAGYRTLSPSLSRALPAWRPREGVELRAEADAKTLTVMLNGQLAWQGPLPPRLQGQDALAYYSGLRTDNAMVEFKFATR